MFREIKQVRQEPGLRRHWFEADGLELVVWYHGSRVERGFQLPYSQADGERALTWRRDSAFRACVAAQRIQLKLGDLRDKWRREGDRWPPAVSQLRTSIGLNTGPCIVGNLGSRTRFYYTMMGDNVNLAARLNSASASWGAAAACTEATRAACQQHGGDRVIFRPLGRVTVKGRPLPVPIHEIVGLKESIETSTRECIGLFELGLARYYSRDWDGAISQFQQSARLEPLSPDRMPGVRTTPSLLFLGYCQQCKAAPPPDDWNGVPIIGPR